MYEIAKELIARQSYADHLGIVLIDCREDWAQLKLPYKRFLGDERVNGGAIASLVDITATCAFWSHKTVNKDSRGATIGFSINFLKLVTKSDIFATGIVKRRGSNVCVGTVEVDSELSGNIAIATVTYKLNSLPVKPSI